MQQQRTHSNMSHPFTAAAFSGALALFAALPSTLHAQAFPKGKNMVSVGYGAVTFLGNLKRTFDPYTDLTYRSLGPLYLKYEHAVADNIGLGLSFAYAENSFSYRYTSTDEAGVERSYKETTERSTYSVLARFNFHMGDSPRFDPYVGFGLGYRDAQWKVRSDAPSGSSGVDMKSLMPFGFELTIGARYFFLENLGVYAEVGGAKSIFQGGLSARF